MLLAAVLPVPRSTRADLDDAVSLLKVISSRSVSIPARAVLAEQSKSRSVYVDGMLENVTVAVLLPSTFFAMSLHVVAISAPPSHIHGLVTSRRLDSVEAERGPRDDVAAVIRKRHRRDGVGVAPQSNLTKHKLV